MAERAQAATRLALGAASRRGGGGRGRGGGVAPARVADSCAVLKRLCSRLSPIERPEATLLYAALMTTRALLTR